MPEISDLLHEAARGPQLSLDLDRVSRRARALRRREQATVSTGAAFAALVVAVPLLLHGGGSQRDEVHLVPAPTLSSAPTSTPTGVASGGRGDVSSGPGRSAQPGSTAAGTPSDPPASPEPEPASASTSPTAVPSQFPRAAGCEVSTTELGANERRTCRFTATEWGGWRISRAGLGAGYVNNTEALVTVQHAGKATQYDGNGSETCGYDIIEPGDLVTVTVKQTDVGSFDFTLGAGADYHC